VEQSGTGAGPPEDDVADDVALLDGIVAGDAARLEDSRARLRRLLRSGDLDRPSWLIGHQEDERRTRGVPADPEGARPR
jgi:hypothetical protein